MSPETAEKFAAKVSSTLLITGHQPQDLGYGINGERHLILASDHNQGVFLPLNLSQTYDMATIVGEIRKFVAVNVPAK
jgi:hypothetical protein